MATPSIPTKAGTPPVTTLTADKTCCSPSGVSTTQLGPHWATSHEYIFGALAFYLHKIWWQVSQIEIRFFIPLNLYRAIIHKNISISFFLKPTI
jgi:hypothetical protein